MNTNTTTLINTLLSFTHVHTYTHFHTQNSMHALTFSLLLLQYKLMPVSHHIGPVMFNLDLHMCNNVYKFCIVMCITTYKNRATCCNWTLTLKLFDGRIIITLKKDVGVYISLVRNDKVWHM